MLFNSYEFLFLFLPLVLLAYFLVPMRGRHLLLACASYLFYGWWDVRFCGLLLFSTAIDFQVGKRLAEASSPGARKGWLSISMVTNLSLLGFFKYFDLFAETANNLSTLLGASGHMLPMLDLVLPVGISFYTFQSMSYSLDIYYGAAKPAKRFSDFACYVALFPQLIAGPIIRYRELADQLEKRKHTAAMFAAGVTLFILGLAKKVLLADGVAPLADLAFASTAPTLLAAWLGVLAYTMQIYFDFSGYSDMAIGLGLFFGFQFPQNFNSPYKAISITDFWRRWHMSLSRWLRDYLYIPLGGNKKGVFRTYLNLFITMLLGGLWHGASWTFILWGGYHGALLAFERWLGKKNVLYKAPGFFQHASTIVLVMFGWVLFRAGSLAEVVSIGRGMVGANGILPSHATLSATGPLAAIALCATVLLTWFTPNTWELSWRDGLAKGVFLAFLFIVCVMTILINTSSPFLYFQF